MFEELKRKYPQFSQFEMDELFNIFGGDLTEIESVCKIANYLEVDSVLEAYRTLGKLGRMADRIKKGEVVRYRCFYCKSLNIAPNPCTCKEWEQEGKEFDDMQQGSERMM